MVDDACYSSYNLTVLIGQKVFSLTKLKGGILVLAEGVYFVGMQVGGIVGVASIQVVVELDKGIELLFICNLANLY